MKCPSCSTSRLAELPTKRGVVVDRCESCKGIWLDRGEIYLFSKRPQRLEEHLSNGLADPQPSNRSCPRCGSVMESGKFPASSIEAEQCQKCGGLWLDSGELGEILELDQRLFHKEVDRGRGKQFESIRSTFDNIRSVSTVIENDLPAREDRDERVQRRFNAIAAGMLPLPNLFFRSASVLVLLYAALFAVLIGVAELGYLPVGTAVGIGMALVVLQFLLGPFLMDFSLSFMYNLSWVGPEQLPAHLREFVERVTTEQNMRFPYFGLLHDGAPNAFTYGHTPNNMRIVISEGILELLEAEESEAVVAHEIGHGKHWDMALMTIAQLVPLLLYYLYRTLIRLRVRGKAGVARVGIAAGAYILYIISEYLVLWFSRCREYHADRFAGRVTGNPNFLASALVKIAYGLASRGGAAATSDDDDGRQSRQAGSFDAIGALGIFDATAARGLVAAATAGGSDGHTADGTVGRENLKSAMQWDLWNPWAKWYELHSTHPLVANRLHYLGDQSAAMGLEPYIVFDRRQPESYWDEFFVDLAINSLPWLLPAVVFGSMLAIAPALGTFRPAIGMCLAAMGLGLLLRLRFSHRSNYFAPLSVAGLLHKVKVSSVRPVPARVRGTIIGKGVPGLIWSEDFVMRDDTGILFLDYRQPLAIWQFFFGLLFAGQYTGQEVEVTGWFRRAPVPYLEIKTITASGRTRRCYVYYIKLAVAIALMLAGCVLAVLGLLSN